MGKIINKSNTYKKYWPLTGAGEGNRTLVVSLEGFCSTIELHPPGPDKKCTISAPSLAPLHHTKHTNKHRQINYPQHRITLPQKSTNVLRITSPLNSTLLLRLFVSLRLYVSTSLRLLTATLRPLSVTTVVLGGGGWIRTNVGVSQQIYSLPPLATRAPLRTKPSIMDFLKAAVNQVRYISIMSNR